MIKNCISIIFLFLLSSCTATIQKQELGFIMKKHNEKYFSVQWNYIGSDQNYHYFHEFIDCITRFPLPNKFKYKIKRDQLIILDPIGFSMNKENWIRLNVQELLYGNQKNKNEENRIIDEIYNDRRIHHESRGLEYDISDLPKKIPPNPISDKPLINYIEKFPTQTRVKKKGSH